jgi:hypothetical protein
LKSFSLKTKECVEQIFDGETLQPKSKFTWNEIYDVIYDEWHSFQIVNEVKNGAEYFVQIEYEAPDKEIYIIDAELAKDMME